MPSSVPVFKSLLCMGSTDCLPFRYTLRCEPLPGWKVAPWRASQRLNSLLFTGQRINNFVYNFKRDIAREISRFVKGPQQKCVSKHLIKSCIDNQTRPSQTKRY